MIKVKINDREYTICKKDTDYFLNQEKIDIDVYQRTDCSYHIIHDDLSLNIELREVNLAEKQIELRIRDRIFTTKITDEKDTIIEVLKASTGSNTLHQKVISPMPGLIQKIFVAEGDSISTGDPLLILNAMKMENVLKSPTNGKVSRISIEEGEQVEKGKVLIHF